MTTDGALQQRESWLPMPATEGLVSVVIPAYNAQSFIADTLKSVLSQDYPEVEVVVVDDGSTDATADIVRGFGPRVICLQQENRGNRFAPPRNRGMAASRGEFITFIDADDLMPPDRISRQVGFLASHPDVALVFCNYVNFGPDGPEPHTHFDTCPVLSALLGERDELILDYAGKYLADENFALTGSFMVRRHLAASLPGFDETLAGSEDFHYYFRLSRHTRSGVLRHVGLMRRIHGGNLTSDSERMLRACITSYADLHASEKDAATRRILRAKVSRFTCLLARHEANRRHYGKAVGGYLRALRINPGMAEVAHTVRGLARTLMMKAGLHTSK